MKDKVETKTKEKYPWTARIRLFFSNSFGSLSKLNKELQNLQKHEETQAKFLDQLQRSGCYAEKSPDKAKKELKDILTRTPAQSTYMLISHEGKYAVISAKKEQDAIQFSEEPCSLSFSFLSDKAFITFGSSGKTFGVNLKGTQGLLNSLYGVHHTDIASREEFKEVSGESFSTQKRKIEQNGSHYSIAAMSTFGQVGYSTKDEDLDKLAESPNYDASSLVISKDPKTQKITGGVVTSADGYFRGVPEISTSAAAGSRFLSEQLLAYDSAQDLSKALRSIVYDTDAYMSAITQEGSANIAGVRLFHKTETSSLQIVGVNVGNQRIMLTNAETGETTQLHNTQGDDDSSSKCFLGGSLQSRGFKDNEIEIISTTINIPPEKAIVWIATDGAWQNFEKRDDNLSIINTNSLQSLLKKQINTSGELSSQTLQQALSDHTLERAKEIRRKIREVDHSHLDLYEKNKGTKDPSIKQQLDQYEHQLKWLRKALDDATITVIQPWQSK